MKDKSNPFSLLESLLIASKNLVGSKVSQLFFDLTIYIGRVKLNRNT
jgi:hypothetical protein